jgi:hypothetical protein
MDNLTIEYLLIAFQAVYIIISVILSVDFFWRIRKKGRLTDKLAGLLYPLNISIPIFFLSSANALFSDPQIDIFPRVLLSSTFVVLPVFILMFKLTYLTRMDNRSRRAS